MWCRLCFTHAWPGWDWLREVQLFFCHCLWVVFSFIQEVPEFMENRSVCCCCCHAGGYGNAKYPVYPTGYIQMIDMICSLSSVSNRCALSSTLYYNLLSSCLGEYFLGAALENSVTQLNPLPASLNTTMMAHGRLSASLSLCLPTLTTTTLCRTR